MYKIYQLPMSKQCNHEERLFMEVFFWKNVTNLSFNYYYEIIDNLKKNDKLPTHSIKISF